ncbi:MAG: DMT family transporter, partial [Candidatus Riesia sp.]|nr:DMT family transporter [Candidatus Riesia sp.]
MKTLNFILVLTLFALFASIFSLQKLNLKYSEPFFLMGFRMFISGLILILYSILSKNIRAIKIKKIHIKFFIYLAIYNIYLNSIFEIWGLENMISSKVCLIYSTSPFITAIISFLILNEKLNIRKSIGIIIGLFGLMPIIYFKSRIENLTLNLSLPEISVILAVISSVLGWIYLKKIIKLGYSFIIANGISMFLGGTLILFHSFVFGENWNILPVKDWSYFIPLTI